jgi:hypothetical protein
MGRQHGQGRGKDPTTLDLMYVAFPGIPTEIDSRTSTHDFMDTRQQLYRHARDILVGIS